MAIKIIGITLTIIGFVSLTVGVLGIFGTNLVAINPWATGILGFIFFVSGLGLLKRQAD